MSHYSVGALVVSAIAIVCSRTLSVDIRSAIGSCPLLWSVSWSRSTAVVSESAVAAWSCFGRRVSCVTVRPDLCPSVCSAEPSRSL